MSWSRRCRAATVVNSGKLTAKKRCILSGGTLSWLWRTIDKSRWWFVAIRGTWAFETLQQCWVAVDSGSWLPVGRILWPWSWKGYPDSLGKFLQRNVTSWTNVRWQSPQWLPARWHYFCQRTADSKEQTAYFFCPQRQPWTPLYLKVSKRNPPGQLLADGKF